MKGSERHRLKENEVALSVARMTEAFENRRREILFGVISVVVAIVAVASFFYWRHYVDTRSRALLAEAMAVADAPVVPATPAAASPGGLAAPATPPPPGSFASERARLEAALAKYTATADAYPSSASGIAARFQAAAALGALGRQADAIQRYKEVVERAGKGLYADGARLGMAAAQAASGQNDAAIATFKELAAAKDGSVPVDGVLMQLARAYAASGKATDAMQTYQRVVDEFPQSIYASVARRELDAAKSGGAL